MNFAAFRNSLKMIFTLAGPLVTAAEEIAPAVLGPQKYAAVAGALQVANEAAGVVTADWPQIETTAKAVINEFANLKHAFDQHTAASSVPSAPPAGSAKVTAIAPAAPGVGTSTPPPPPPVGKTA